MTRRQRRLDGLATPERGTSVSPPSPPDREKSSASEEPPPPARRSLTQSGRGKSAASSQTGGKHLSVPTPLARMLRTRAQERDRFQTDLVLECLALFAPTVDPDGGKQRISDAGPFDRPQRRAHRGRTVTALTLYLSQGEVDAIDDLARVTGHTRSRLVARALEAHLAEIS